MLGSTRTRLDSKNHVLVNTGRIDDLNVWALELGNVMLSFQKMSAALITLDSFQSSEAAAKPIEPHSHAI